MLAVQIYREGLPDRFSLREHSGLEQIVLDLRRQAAPAARDGLSQRLIEVLIGVPSGARVLQTAPNSPKHPRPPDILAPPGVSQKYI
jgi:hypothetical protein